MEDYQRPGCAHHRLCSHRGSGGGLCQLCSGDPDQRRHPVPLPVPPQWLHNHGDGPDVRLCPLREEYHQHLAHLPGYLDLCPDPEGALLQVYLGGAVGHRALTAGELYGLWKSLFPPSGRTSHRCSDRYGASPSVGLYLQGAKRHEPLQHGLRLRSVGHDAGAHPHRSGGRPQQRALLGGGV